jgi:hypothetical protein
MSMTKRKARPRRAEKAAVPKTPVADITLEQQIVGATLLGKVKQFDAETRLLTLLLEAPLAAGETIRVKGRVTDLTQRAERMLVKGRAVQSAVAGEPLALEAADQVQPGDAVYKI